MLNESSLRSFKMNINYQGEVIIVTTGGVIFAINPKVNSLGLLPKKTHLTCYNDTNFFYLPDNMV